MPILHHISYIVTHMFVTELLLKDFRNYGEQNIHFAPEINIITGANGAGKTNIIEALSILSNLKSFRNIHDQNIIRWGCDTYYCSTTIEQSQYRKFEVGYMNGHDRVQKKFKIDDIEIKNINNYFGKFLTVIFSPFDIYLIHGVPEFRRRFFDSIISKVNPEYFRHLRDFKKILYSRNSLLKQLRERPFQAQKELETWDRLFAEKSSYIMRLRSNFIETFNKYFIRSYEHISSETDIPSITYKPSLESNNEEHLMRILANTRKKDIYSGSTGIGPQRDDYRILNSKQIDFTNYSSQGQKRTSAISFKIAENEIIEDSTNEKCVILVDDIFSELDAKRRENMIDFLKKGNQIIFTMVNIQAAELLTFTQCKKFHINEKGELHEP